MKRILTTISILVIISTISKAQISSSFNLLKNKVWMNNEIYIDSVLVPDSTFKMPNYKFLENNIFEMSIDEMKFDTLPPPTGNWYVISPDSIRLDYDSLGGFEIYKINYLDEHNFIFSVIRGDTSNTKNFLFEHRMIPK